MKNEVVVDASIALKWVLQEADSDIAEALLLEWNTKETIVLAPALLAYEVTNALYQNMRQDEITLERVKQALRGLFLLEISLYAPIEPNLGIRALELAQLFNLPATYDAHYLALAETKNCPLWTADMKMWRAVKDKVDWVRLLSDYQPG